jgi:hypothetical protein
MVTAEEREALERQVQARVHREVKPQQVRDAVDRVVAALPESLGAPVAAGVVVVVSATSMPDLASRLRGDLRLPPGVGMATAGRHTVVVARVPGDEVPAWERAAAAVGARCALRDAS